MATILIPIDLSRNTTNPTVTLILTPHLHLLKKPLKERSKVKPRLQRHMKNLHHMEDINPLMAVTVHHPLHLTVYLPQHMAVMEKPTHHLHLMNLMVHLHQHMAVMAKPTHPPHLIHTQHSEYIANPHHNLTMVIKNPHMATLHHHPHLPHTDTATLPPRMASQSRLNLLKSNKNSN